MLHLYCKLLQLQQVFGFVILGSWQVYYLTVVHSGVDYIIWICFFNDWENMIPVESLISQKNKNVQTTMKASGDGLYIRRNESIWPYKAPSPYKQ